MSGTDKNILSAKQFDRETLERLISTAKTLAPVARGQFACNALRGAVLANLFFEPSTRSRISFGAAFARLGGAVLDTAGKDITSIAKGESFSDTARVVSGYADAIVIRHSDPESVESFANAALVPVINAGAGDAEHPTQALTDLLTMDQELSTRGKNVDGCKIAIVGDLRYGRTSHSLINLISNFDNIQIALVSPQHLRMPASYLEAARGRGHRIVETQSLAEGLRGADVIYLTRYQKERFSFDHETRAQAETLRLTATVYSRFALPDAVILHPLPRDAQFAELATDLDASPNLAIFRQTDNGVPIRMALFCHIFGVTDSVATAIHPVAWRSRS